MVKIKNLLHALNITIFPLIWNYLPFYIFCTTYNLNSSIELNYSHKSLARNIVTSHIYINIYIYLYSLYVTKTVLNFLKFLFFLHFSFGNF